MIDEQTRNNQATRPNRPSLEDTTQHPSILDDTLPHRPAIDEAPPTPAPDDTQPIRPAGARPPSRRGRLLADLRKVVLLTGGLAVGIVVLLIALYRIAPPPRTNILVMGIDSRPGEGWLARSDSMMLVTINPARMYVGLLSIPRDLYLNIPGYGNNRINVAHILGEQQHAGGGPALTARTVEEDFRVPVQRTVRMQFDGFVRIVDAAGGVDVNVQRRIVDTSYPTTNYGFKTVTFETGWQHMDGERALEYARTRHADNDFYRAERQQQVVSALVRKMASPQNWVYWPSVLTAVSENVQTDITPWDVVVLAPTLLWVGPGSIDRAEITDTMATGFQTSAGADVLRPHWELINPLLDKMFRN